MASSKTKENLLNEFRTIRQLAVVDGLSDKAVKDLFVNSVTTSLLKEQSSTAKCSAEKHEKRGYVYYSVIVAVLAVVAFLYYQTMDPRCAISSNLLLLELARPAVSCDVCKDMKQVPTVDGDTFTKEKFLKDYAYNGIPLLIKGGAKNWTALDTFSFNYLKELYEQTDGALEAVEFDCQFFPYKTSFLTLAEVFNMSEARSRIAEGEKQWYVGW